MRKLLITLIFVTTILNATQTGKITTSFSLLYPDNIIFSDISSCSEYLVSEHKCNSVCYKFDINDTIIKEKRFDLIFMKGLAK